MKYQFNERRRFFDVFWESYEHRFSHWRFLTKFLPVRIRSKYTCPCCGYPTLDERIDWEICLICWWEDDGQDDFDENEERGTNVDAIIDQPYTLKECRNNFEEYFTSFRPSDERHERLGNRTKDNRKEVVDIYDKIMEISMKPSMTKEEVITIKKLICESKNKLKGLVAVEPAAALDANAPVSLLR